MEVSPEEARAALDDVRDAMAETRRALADGGLSTILIVWGAVWMVGFLMTQFVPRLAGWTWLPLDLIGIVTTFVVLWRSPIKSVIDRGVWVFWLMLLAYAVLWFLLIAERSPRSVTVTRDQMSAYICTVIMFAYVVMGLWLRSRLLFWLGLAVTAIAVLSLFLLAPYFSLAMALAGGGAVAGTGVAVRVAWR
jgi:hypothetical protein